MKQLLLFLILGIMTIQSYSQNTSLIFSEYIEGSSSNKYLEIYNGTGADVDLSGYIVNLYANGSTDSTATLELTGTLTAGDVYIIGNSSADAYTGTIDVTSNVTYYNGDDAIALKTTNNEFVDIIGRIGEKVSWSDGDYATTNHTLIRKSSVASGVNVNPAEGEGFATLTTEWDVYDSDEVSYLGSYPITTTSVASPSFSVDEGTYTETQYVELSTTTDGATIYYTLDGTAPDNASTEYSAELEISETTTINAIAYYNDDYSDVSSATYTISSATIVADLGELRNAYDANSTDVIYSVSGRVYVSAVYNDNNFYIQDDNGAIVIYDGNDVLVTSHSIGDGIINITGTLTEYNGVLELLPIEDADDYTTNNTVSSTTVSISDLNNNWENYESRLVTINTVSFDDTSAGTAFSGYSSYTITDEDTNDFNLFTKFGDLDATTIPSSANVTGIAVLYNGTTFEICPRYADDIVSLNSTAIDELSAVTTIYPNPFSSFIHVECQNIKTIQLSNISGEVVKSQNIEGADKASVSTSDLADGVYIIKITKEDGSSTIKKLIKK